MAVYLGRFLENVENYPGWNLATDSKGAATLLRLLGRLRSVPSAAPRSVDVSPPGRGLLAVPNNGDSAVVSAARLRVLLDAHKDNAARIDETSGEVTLTLGTEDLRRIEAALCDPEGAFDTAIVDEPSVWYWGIRAEGAAQQAAAPEGAPSLAALGRAHGGCAAKSLGRRSVR